jgi:hypothetical protein
MKRAQAWISWLLGACIGSQQSPDWLPRGGGWILLVDASRLKIPAGCGDDVRMHSTYDFSAGRERRRLWWPIATAPKGSSTIGKDERSDESRMSAFSLSSALLSRLGYPSQLCHYQFLLARDCGIC